MTAYQLIGGLPAVTLDAGCTVTFEAIDPDTGAAVTGVAITQAAIYATNVTPGDPVTAPEETLTLAELDGPSIGA
jgi:hypothetical protein